VCVQSVAVCVQSVAVCVQSVAVCVQSVAVCVQSVAVYCRVRVERHSVLQRACRALQRVAAPVHSKG